MGNIAYHEFLAETRVSAATPTLDPCQIADMETRKAMMDDAQEMQTATDLACREAGRSAPLYQLSELIGKGSYGRVYKATDRQTGGVVAIKMVDIEEGDGANPGADTYGDIQQEIKTLKLLRDVGAANVNLVIDAFMVEQSMWIVTDYCAGGSVATLMKPFIAASIKGLKGPRLDEKWIIPILREVAEAVRWIHTHGVIHRDIKCANIFITQEGGVQLGDFGVAAMVQTKFDKRRTVIGTLHWMAPELFDSVVSYGPAVDIWAFGAVAYEMASGLPPNAMESHRARVDPSQFGEFLNGHIPRLEGPEYSDGLKDLVAFCLEKDPDRRPTIERVTDHAYIRDTSLAYPADSLSQLVRNYRMWEKQGGVRQSLLNPNIGAQVAAIRTSAETEQDEWNFSTTLEFDQQIETSNSPSPDLQPNTAPPPLQPKARRRPPPHVLARLKAPLEKVFDPNTRTDYTENSRTYYAPGGDGFDDDGMQFSSAPDLPLRDDSSTAAIRESLIDLDACLGGDFDTPTSSMDDMNTLRPSRDPVPLPHSAAPYEPASGSTLTRGGPRRGPTPSSGMSFANFARSPNQPGKDGIPKPPHRHTSPGDRGSLQTLIDLDESMFGITDNNAGGTSRRFTRNNDSFNGGNQNNSIVIPPPGDRGSLQTLIDLDESMFGINDNNASKHVSPEYPSTPPRTANGTVPPWAVSTSALVSNEDWLLSMSPLDSINRHNRSNNSSNGSNGSNQYRPPAAFMDTPPRTRNPLLTANFLLSPPDEDDEDDIYGGGGVAEDDDSNDDDGDGGSSRPFWGRATVGPPEPPSTHVMEGRASQRAVADEMKRLLGSLSGHLSDVGRQVKQLEPRRAEGARSGS
ncbi:STE STE20 YSK kinase [Apiospora saccharicola]|uniref:non-specific serine/threonine protein kinase n=1 Tax=Apiospora saccharicola TaxID=335842 RepID=A0ABR1VEH8_9PEZI